MCSKTLYQLSSIVTIEMTVVNFVLKSVSENVVHVCRYLPSMEDREKIDLVYLL